MMKKAAFSLLLPLLLAGCVFRSAEPTQYYDLELPAADSGSPGYRLMVQEFTNRSGSGSRMLLRLADGRMEHDGGSKWLLSPEELVPRALNLANNRQQTAEPEKSLTVKGTLTAFEADTVTEQFVLAGYFTITGGNSGRTGQPEFFRLELPLDSRNAPGIARAASAATALLNARILERAAAQQ